VEPSTDFPGGVRHTFMCYDELNRRTRMVVNLTDTDSEACETSYDPDHGDNNDQNLVMDYVYDSRGNLIHEIDPLDRVTQYDYDALNRVTQVIKNFQGSGQFNPSTPDINVTQNMSYDGLGRLVAITEDATTDTRTTHFAYDGLDRQTTVIQNYVDGI